MPELNAMFSALADPTRRAILARLLEGAASVGELAEPFSLGVRTISKHIAVLENAGLISRENQGQRRLSRLEARPLAQLDEWLGPYRSVWNERHANIDTVLANLKRKKQ
jgi:DNA-binding transcriptional ArsR family regulator